MQYLYASLTFIQLFKFLKLEDLYELELSKFMHQLQNNKLTGIFCEYFAQITTIPLTWL